MACKPWYKPFLTRQGSALLAARAFGPVVAGSSPAAAADAIEELEETAKLFLLLQGRRIRTLTAEQVTHLRKQHSG